MTTYCMNCGAKNENLRVHHDCMGSHCVCPACEASYPVDDPDDGVTRWDIVDGTFLEVCDDDFLYWTDNEGGVTVRVQGAILENLADEQRHAQGLDGMDTDMDMWYNFCVRFYKTNDGQITCDGVEYDVEFAETCTDGIIPVDAREMVTRVDNLLRQRLYATLSACFLEIEEVPA